MWKWKALAIALLAVLALSARATPNPDAPPPADVTEEDRHEGRAPSPRLARDASKHKDTLGLEVGYANIIGVAQKFGAVFKDEGVNESTGLYGIFAEGAALGDSKTKEMTLLFDSNGVLVLVRREVPNNFMATVRELARTHESRGQAIEPKTRSGKASFAKDGRFVHVYAVPNHPTMEIYYATETGVKNNFEPTPNPDRVGF